MRGLKGRSAEARPAFSPIDQESRLAQLLDRQNQRRAKCGNALDYGFHWQLVDLKRQSNPKVEQ